MAAAVSPEALAALQAAIAAFPTSGSDNFYAFLGEATRRQVYDPPAAWVPKLLLACSVMIGALAVVDLAIIGLRVRAGGWWLFRLVDSPVGTIIQPHVVNAYCCAYIVFAGVAQGGIWSIHRLTSGDYTAIPAALLWSALVWIPLILAVWCGASSTTLAHLTSQTFLRSSMRVSASVRGRQASGDTRRASSARSSLRSTSFRSFTSSPCVASPSR